jgi:hypothetical protein
MKTNSILDSLSKHKNSKNKREKIKSYLVTILILGSGKARMSFWVFDLVAQL